MNIQGVLHAAAMNPPQPVAQSAASGNSQEQADSNPTAIKVTTGSSEQSSLAAVAKAITQEATETHVQTKQEARNGDFQAQRRLAKEAANPANANHKGAEFDKIV